MAYTYDDANRISSATGMGFTWDDNGNLLTWDDGSDDWAYRYDSEDRLINVEENGVASARYTYDADDRRVRSWDAVGTTDCVYSGLNIIDEVRGGVHEKHIYAGSMHLASNSSGTVEYFHVDHLGSTRLKTDASGNAIYSSNYEPYGPEYGESGSEEFRYTGKQEDPTGLYYFGARYYDPVTGRFITCDLVYGDLSDPQSLNRYVYCRNNPHKYVDPDGRIFLAVPALALLAIPFAIYGVITITPVIIHQLGVISSTAFRTPNVREQLGYIDYVSNNPDTLTNELPPKENRKKMERKYKDPDTNTEYEEYTDPTRPDIKYRKYHEGGNTVWERDLEKPDGGVSSIRKIVDINGKTIAILHRYVNIEGVETDKWHTKYQVR